MQLATFRHLVDSLHDAVLVIRKPERTITWANPAAARMFGRPVDEITRGGTESLHVDTEHFQRFHELSIQPLERDGRFETRFQMRRANGDVFPVHVTVNRFLDDDGQAYAVSVVRDMTAEAAQEKALAESEERFRQIAESLREVFWVSDPINNRIEYVSPAYERVWDRSTESLYADPSSFKENVHPDDRARVSAYLDDQLLDECDLEYRIIRPDGQIRWIWDRSAPVRNADGRVYRVVGVAEDVSKLRLREAELLQAQKLEAMGRLTGGIAHDFNNMLMVIEGNAELLKERLGADPDATRLADDVLLAARQAGSLTSRLLAFARRAPIQRKRVDVNAVVGAMGGMLERTLGAEIEIRLLLAEDLWPATADRAQLDAALVNFAINARDAMPDGGCLELRTRNVRADSVIEPGLAAGDYIRISVSDTGTGMPPEVVRHVFEPFFTTKDAGKGTGLGLSVIFGLAREHGGHVSVDSTPGQGSTFHLYLPRHAGASLAPRPDRAAPATGHETILVVEDERMIRLLLATQLSELGYAVIEAETGREALELLGSAVNIDLLITDVVLGGNINGVQVTREARRLRPAMPVMFASGYGTREQLAGQSLPPDVPLLMKPFSRADLAAMVRSLMDAVA